MEIREATDDERSSLELELRDSDIVLVSDAADCGVVVGRDAFDSDCLGLSIWRVREAWATTGEELTACYRALSADARERPIDQLLRRLPADHAPEIWALERCGFELVDGLVTFSIGLAERLADAATPAADLVIGPATDDDIAAIAQQMDLESWISRYETDPHYDRGRVLELRRRWLWNSQRGRAAVVLACTIGGQPAGYVTGMLEGETGVIDLVETLAAFRGRGVASALLASLLGWFSTRVDVVTVGTQITNFNAARLYEKAGFRLTSAHFTYRLQVTTNR